MEECLLEIWADTSHLDKTLKKVHVLPIKCTPDLAKLCACVIGMVTDVWSRNSYVHSLLGPQQCECRPLGSWEEGQSCNYCATGPII